MRQHKRIIQLRGSRRAIETAESWRYVAMNQALAVAKVCKGVYLQSLAEGKPEAARQAKQREEFYLMRYTRLWRMLSK